MGNSPNGWVGPPYTQLVAAPGLVTDPGGLVFSAIPRNWTCVSLSPNNVYAYYKFASRLTSFTGLLSSCIELMPVVGGLGVTQVTINIGLITVPFNLVAGAPVPPTNAWYNGKLTGGDLTIPPPFNTIALPGSFVWPSPVAGPYYGISVTGTPAGPAGNGILCNGFWTLTGAVGVVG